MVVDSDVVCALDEEFCVSLVCTVIANNIIVVETKNTRMLLNLQVEKNLINFADQVYEIETFGLMMIMNSISSRIRRYASAG